MKNYKYLHILQYNLWFFFLELNQNLCKKRVARDRSPMDRHVLESFDVGGNIGEHSLFLFKSVHNDKSDQYRSGKTVQNNGRLKYTFGNAVIFTNSVKI